MWRPRYTVITISVLVLILVLTLTLVFTLGASDTAAEPLVHTNVGTIRGLRASDGDYSMFMGIPYARVDETNPFGPSTPYPTFDEEFVAHDDTAICPQIEEFNNTIVGTLDCLHLNIYVPDSISSTNGLPVLVWIYGGALKIGYASRFLYGPSFIIRHDIILVTLNYRVGPYGFMCLNTPAVPGNQGIKDQLLALRWIRDNIEAFGGDAGQITIFGESAGGMSVDLHVKYSNENLFNKAILQSGTSLLDDLTLIDPDQTLPIRIAQSLGFETADMEEALSYLATVDPLAVIDAQVSGGTGVCVEREFDGVERYIWDYPVNVRLTNKELAILIGYNSRETLSFHGSLDMEAYANTEIIYNNLNDYFNFDEEHLNKMYDITRQFYFGDVELNDELMENYIDYTSDFMFVNPSTRTIEMYLEDGIETVFHYMFSYDGERNFVKQRINTTHEGAAHADEISYLFDVSYLQDPNPEDQLTIDRMTAMWTNFAKYGDPTPEVSDLLPVQWRPINSESFYYLDIGPELRLGTRPFNRRMAYWKLFYHINGNLKKGYRDDTVNAVHVPNYRTKARK